MSERREGSTSSSSCTSIHPQPHAIVIPFPTQGHVNPMMELANQLHSKGVLVTLILTQHIQTRLNLASSTTTPTTTPTPNQEEEEEEEVKVNGGRSQTQRGIRVVLISDGLPEDMDRMGNYWELIDAMNGFGNAQFEKVIESQSQHITCVVADSFLPYTKHVAHKKGIPWVAFWTQPLCVYTIYYRAFFHLSIPTLTTQEVGSRQEKTVALLNSIPGFPTMETSDLPSFLQTENITEIGYQYFLLQFKNMQDTPILANSFQELEEESMLAIKDNAIPRLTCIGPLLPPALFKGSKNKDQEMEVKHGSSLLAEEWSCMEWLNQKAPKSVLYISFGSLVSFPKEQIEEILVGVCESGVAFLWVTRDMQKDIYHMFEEYNTSANANSINACNNAMFVGWAPQLAVLSHAALGGFLTHVGWNSTLESIACGVPMLTMPCFSDQTTTAKFASNTWKSALRLQPKHGSCGLVTRDVIKEGVQLLFSPNSHVQDQAHQLHEAAHKAVAIGGSSHSNFQSFVNNLVDTITS